jgi:hypothetical protein
MALLALTDTASGDVIQMHDLAVIEVIAEGTGSLVSFLKQEDGLRSAVIVDEAPAAIVAAGDILYTLTLVGGSDTRHINAKRISYMEENSDSNAVVWYDFAGSQAKALEADADLATEAAAIGLLI